MDIKVSVLIPFYNAEDFVIRCIKSVLAQRFCPIELVLIDDASTDQTLRLVKDFLSTQSPVKYTILKNTKRRGMSYCRNTLLRSAKGKYVLFIDACDWISSHMLEDLYHKAEEDSSDIIVSDFWLDTLNESELIEDKVFPAHEDNVRNAIEQNEVYTSLWNKLLLKDFLVKNECDFSEDLNLFDGRLFMIKAYSLTSNISKVDKAYCHHSIDKKPLFLRSQRTEDNIRQILMFWDLLDEFMKKNGAYETFEQSIKFSKIKNKSLWLLQVRNYSLLKKYSSIFRDFELEYTKYLLYGSQRLIIKLIHYRVFILAYLLSLALSFKIKLLDKQDR